MRDECTALQECIEVNTYISLQRAEKLTNKIQGTENITEGSDSYLKECHTCTAQIKCNLPTFFLVNASASSAEQFVNNSIASLRGAALKRLVMLTDDSNDAIDVEVKVEQDPFD